MFGLNAYSLSTTQTELARRSCEKVSITRSLSNREYEKLNAFGRNYFGSTQVTPKNTSSITKEHSVESCQLICENAENV